MMALFDLGYPATEHKSSRAGYRGTSLQTFHARFPEDEECLRHIFFTRFGETPRCPKCGRESRWYRIKGTKRFQHSCGKAIAPLAGTIFEQTHIPLRIWFYAMLHFANSTNGVTTTFLARHLGLSQKSAFRLADRIRTHLAAIDVDCRIGRPGKPFEIRLEYLVGVRTAGYPTRGSARAVLLGDADRVHTTLVGKPRRHILRAIIAQNAVDGAVPFTTCRYTHHVLSEFGTRLPTVRLVDTLVHPETGVNTIHSFLTYLRKPMQNTYRRVDYSNLWKYIKEFEFSYNRRSHSQDTFWNMVGQFPNLSQERCAQLEARFSRSRLLTRERR